MVSENQKNFKLNARPNASGEKFTSGSQVFTGSNGKWLFSNQQVVSTTFTKDAVSGLSVWYDFNDTAYMSLDGSNGINIILNKAGIAGYNLTQATAGYRPIYTPNRINGKATAVFNATSTNFMERDTADIAQPASVFFVFKAPTTASQIIPLSFSASFISLNYSSAGVAAGATSISAGAYSANGGNFVSNTCTLLKAVVKDNTGSIALNNGVPVVLDPGPNVLSCIGLGRHWGSSYYYTGDIAEVLVYAKETSAEEDAIIYAYINKKWGIY